jgi:hypothetical protein
MRNKPISQVEIEEEIIRLTDLLENETESFEQLAVDSAVKESNYKASWAKEYLGAKGSIKEREAWADYKLEDMAMQFKISEALVKSKREKLNSLRTNVDALRTLAANVRAQVMP